jgi:hypothetical protein
MPMTFLSNAQRVLVSATAGLLGLLVGCAAPPPATNLSDEQPFEQAVAQATDGLAAQTQKLPAFLAKVESKVNKRSVVLDPMLDAVTGQQTAATVLLENRVSERLTTKTDQFEILPFQSANLARAQYLLTGTMTRVEGSAANRKRALQINIALTELKSGPSSPRRRRSPGTKAWTTRRSPTTATARCW